MKNVIGTCARLSDGEIPLLLINDKLFGSAKEGILLTTSKLPKNISLKGLLELLTYKKDNK